MALLHWMEIIFDVANVLQNSPNFFKTMKRQHMKTKKKETGKKLEEIVI